MIRNLFILVPAFVPTGPVKGAIALANALAPQADVTVAALKSGPGADAPLHPNVRSVCLADLAAGLRGRISAYRTMLEESGGRSRVVSLSMCFSADFANALCARSARIYASVRGNLLQNYRFDYGAPGMLLALAHLAGLRRFDGTVAMSAAMADQVQRYSGSRPAIIPNFVDEQVLERYRRAVPNEGPLRLLFLGSLTRRKQPQVVLAALQKLRCEGVQAHLDMIGGGPLRAQLTNEIAALGLEDDVTLHGHLANPYPIIAQADAMVLPSISEGLSRAALEALYLGVPCVLRDADGNAELIDSGWNGALVRDETALPAAMQKAAALARVAAHGRKPLLRERFRQDRAAAEYLHYMEGGT